MNKEKIIEIKSLVKKFPIGGDFFTALNDINLSVCEGEFSGLVGPSGSGKSTTIDILLGLLIPSKGLVQVDKTPLKD